MHQWSRCTAPDWKAEDVARTRKRFSECLENASHNFLPCGVQGLCCFTPSNPSQWDFPSFEIMTNYRISLFTGQPHTQRHTSLSSAAPVTVTLAALILTAVFAVQTDRNSLQPLCQ